MRFNDKKFAEEYEKRLSKEGYPGNLLDIVLSEINGAISVIDVGAGSGFFTIPLLENGYRVTAVEPSVYMMDILKRKIRNNYKAMLQLYDRGWETWQGERADALICIHSIYPMYNIKNALKKMKSSSEKTVLIVKSDKGSETMSEIIRNAFNMNRGSSGFYKKTIQFLDELGIGHNSCEIEQIREYHFFDLKEEARYYCNHLNLKDSDLEIVENLIRDSSGKKGLYRDAVITF